MTGWRCSSRTRPLPRADQQRLSELEALFGLQQSFNAKIQTTAAQVISNGISNFEWDLMRLIDWVSSDGLAVDMPNRRERRARRSYRPP